MPDTILFDEQPYTLQLLSDISQFVEENAENPHRAVSKWINSTNFYTQLYLRVGLYTVYGFEPKPCIVIANIQILNSKNGIYSQILEHCAQLGKKFNLWLVIENVHDQNQNGIYLRRNFQQIQAQPHGTSFFLKIPAVS